MVWNLPNLITLLRIVCAPVMWWLIGTEQREAFAWVLTLAFTTDIVDGQLARRFRKETKIGSILDSYGDTLTILTGLVGAWMFEQTNFKSHLVVLLSVISLHLIQLILCLWRYGRPSSFHTYSAKTGALAIGCFLIYTMFFGFNVLFFHLTMVVLTIDALEESVLVFLIPEWRNDVKGIWWVLKAKNQSTK
jgi:CDP-diacylglycerol--glycerol-3-phosphate 3-phosphatidyltransferase